MTRLLFNLAQGFKNVIRNKNTSLSTVLSEIAGLFIFGIILAILMNLNNYIILSQKDFSDVQIFLKDDANVEDIKNLQKKIAKNPIVGKVTFESKEMAMTKFKESLGSDAYLLDGLDNTLENSFIIDIKSVKHSDEFVNKIKKNPFVSSCNYYKSTIDKLIKISRYVSIGAILILILIFTLILVVISNTIRISIFSRMKQINIMKYIGATNWFIRWPFIIEGFILGLLGSSIAAFASSILYKKVFNSVVALDMSFFSKYMIHYGEMTNIFFKIFIPAGIGVGIIGSLVSLRKYLKV